jgi:hypothetical protein
VIRVKGEMVTEVEPMDKMVKESAGFLLRGKNDCQAIKKRSKSKKKSKLTSTYLGIVREVEAKEKQPK